MVYTSMSEERGGWKGGGRCSTGTPGKLGARCFDPRSPGKYRINNNVIIGLCDIPYVLVVDGILYFIFKCGHFDIKRRNLMIISHTV